jgi:hypothetical protein
MSLLQNSNAISAGGYDINNSLRFRASATAFLSRTPSVAGDRKTWTWSAWVKRGALASGGNYRLFTCFQDLNNQAWIRFSSDSIQIASVVGGTEQATLITTALFRDPSAWYHIVAVFNTTSATASDRVQLYVNGVRITAFNTATYPAQNYDGFINTTNTHRISTYDGTTEPFDGYLTEVYFVNGTALTPTSFGETDTTTGVWKPKAYTGTYGTNGFYLPFSDTSITPILVNTTSAVQNTAATTIPINVPSGTANDDLMILFVASSGTANTWTTPAGWTVWKSNFNGRAIYYRTASSEPASYTITQSGSATSDGYILTYRFATIDVIGGYGSAGSPSVAPSITTTANNAIVFYSVVSGGQADATYTTPSGFTPIVSDSDGTTPSSAIFSRVQATAGVTGTASSTPSAGNPSSLQFAIKPISPSATLGKDFSSNNNTWTTNNISLTAGVTYDAMTDVPTLTSATIANYCVLNTLDKASTVTNGNLTSSGGAAHQSVRSTIQIPTTGKWYAEAITTSATNSSLAAGFGLMLSTTSLTAATNVLAGAWNIYAVGDRTINRNGTGTTFGTGFTAGDVLQIAVDSTNNQAWFGVNNVWYNSTSGTTGDPSAGTNPTVTSLPTGLSAFVSHYSNTMNANFGQRPFVYTPPTGFVRLNTFNLPDSTVKKGNSVMDVTLWTGNGSTQTITNSGGFRPDLVWQKSRSSGTAWHNLIDSVRGVGNRLFSNSTDAQSFLASSLTSFNSNGFSIGDASDWNTNGSTNVGWQWQAGQGSTSSNTSGSITSTVSVNTIAGFSIVTYTGTGANATVGHGLGVAPKFIIIKNRSAVNNWIVATTIVDGSYDLLALNLTDAKTDSPSSVPTSTVFSIGTASAVNGSGNSMLAYCWAEIAGFSAFGSYTGNGSTDGPFVYLGFRPEFVLIKNTTSAFGWHILDTARNTYNLATNQLFPNTSAAEGTGAWFHADLLSNGFKLKLTAAESNSNGSNYIYMAFAENPFKNALAR